MTTFARLLTILSIFLMAMLAGHAIGFSMPGGLQEHTLSWQSPQQFPVNEDEYVRVISFHGAVYGDSLAAIPRYVYRVESDVPHFSHQFALKNKVFEPLSAAEDLIIRESGFSRDSIVPDISRGSSRGQTFDMLQFYPFRYLEAEDRYEKLVSFDLQQTLAYDPELRHHIPDNRYAENSVLAEGSWYKLCVEETGIHRLDHDDLEDLGIDPSSVQKQNIRLFGNGSGMLPEANDAPFYDDLVENAIYVSGSETGTFGADDYVLFYGRSPDTWFLDTIHNGAENVPVFRHRQHLYSSNSCYFITTDQGPGKRIESQPEITEAPTAEVTTFRDFAIHQRDLDNLLGSGRVWFGEVFDATTSRDFSFDFPNLAGGHTATVEAYLAARAPVQSSFTVSAGSQQANMFIQSINPADYNGYYVRTVNDYLEFTADNQDAVTVSLTYNRPGSGTRGWLNYLTVNADRQLRFTGGQMEFRQLDHVGPGEVAEYVLSDAPSGVRVWDVTDRFAIREQESSQNGNNQRFRLPGDSLRTFIAFDESLFLNPILEGEVPNQNLHAMSPKDMFIVVPDTLLPAAERLADFRRETNGLSVGVVTTRQVYKEFSSGSADLTAIRNFMRMFYERARSETDMPKYLLLFGNGTYDNKDIFGYGGNLIPTFQSYASLSNRTTYMTDDYFGLLSAHEGGGSEGLLDLGIGRLPVRTLEEAGIMVDKIIRYEKRYAGMAPDEEDIEFIGTISNYADWRNRVVFVADDGDNNRHFNDAELLANNLIENYPVYNVEKIYLDAYRQVTMAGGARYPDVNKAINEAVNQGALMINYIGHGGVRGLAHQRVLTFEDIATWENRYNMPVFMTATCEFSSFDQPDPEDLSAGVRIVLKPSGGTAAMYTTTRLAWSGNNLTLNNNFMNTVFERDEAGNPHRAGDLIRIAKNLSGGASIPMQLRNFVLLGDPSMQMAYPEHRVVTENMPDTIRAYQEVTIDGYVTDQAGNKLTGYNGMIYPTIYDKKQTFRTLGNNTGSNPADFSMRNSVLYKGKASVVNGSFSFSFIVPRNIAYDYGSGRISYYVDDGYEDGHGYYEDFVIGGTLDDFIPDNQGPEIDLYMNDTTFVSGDYTDENPILLALLYDESGINMAGGIGHDIVAFHNDSSDPIRLTHYYEADMDTYKSGRVVYPFRNLDEGPHNLTVRAWDTHNNPSTATIDFVVAGGGDVILEDLMNYPNPFSYDTWFTFKHNQAFHELDVRIDIFDLQGQLVNTIEERVVSPGYRATPIHWDGVSNDGRRLGNGVYVYRVTINTPDGKRSRKAERLVIFR